MKTIYDSLGFLFTKASEKIQKKLAVVLQEEKISYKHMGLLLVIQEHSGISQKEAGEIQRIDRTTMTQMIDLLEGLGLVKRIPQPNNRRAYGLFLTEKGSDRVEVLWQHIQEAQGKALERLSAEEVMKLKEYLLLIVKEEQDEER